MRFENFTVLKIVKITMRPTIPTQQTGIKVEVEVEVEVEKCCHRCDP